jgi:hypothetical protein
LKIAVQNPTAGSTRNLRESSDSDIALIAFEVD